MVFHHGGASLGQSFFFSVWSFIRVVFHQDCHQGGLSLGWFFTGVVLHWGGPSLGQSFGRPAFHQGVVVFFRVVFHQGGL